MGMLPAITSISFVGVRYPRTHGDTSDGDDKEDAAYQYSPYTRGFSSFFSDFVEIRAFPRTHEDFPIAR